MTSFTVVKKKFTTDINLLLINKILEAIYIIVREINFGLTGPGVGWTCLSA
jgi:hypothetical protein